MTSAFMHYVFPSDLGWMAVAWKDSQLTRFTFGHPSRAAAIASLESDETSTASAEPPPAWIGDLASRLQSYASGHNEQFTDVPLDLAHLSVFQTRVVRACRRIVRGRVRTYAELATAAGSPGAARAVGNCMASNRFPIIVPCHRVVGSAGSLGGFSARDGINMKRRMLEMEGALLHKPEVRARRSTMRRRSSLAGASG